MAQNDQPETDSLYPVIETFIEAAQREDITALLSPIKEGLASLKGPRADLGKKVGIAVDRTEELLLHLVQLREKIEEDRKSAPGRKR